MRIFAVLLLASVVPTAALAQAPKSPFEQALSDRLMQELNTSLQCSAGVVMLQQVLQQAQMRITDLEKQLEAAKNPPPPEQTKPDSE